MEPGSTLTYTGSTFEMQESWKILEGNLPLGNHPIEYELSAGQVLRYFTSSTGLWHSHPNITRSGFFSICMYTYTSQESLLENKYEPSRINTFSKHKYHFDIHLTIT